VNRHSREDALSDALGAIILISVVALGIAIAGMLILSNPPQDKVPAISADITTVGRTIIITHNGGDTLRKSEMQIVVDGVDYTNRFTRLDGTGWSAWSVGDYLNYTVPDTTAMPQGVSIYYLGGRSSYLIQSMGVPSAVSGSYISPIAAFTSNPMSGTAPLTVQFTDQSTGTSSLTYSWDFGDGSAVSTLQSPSHQYTMPGIYTVKQTVTNLAGSSIKTGTITVNLAPTAAFTLNPTSGFIPLTVQFTDHSTGTTPLTYAWDFGDGIGTSTIQNPSYTYTTAGTYTVKETVTNIAGNSAATTSLTTTVQPAPVANFFGKPTTGLVPFSVQFNDTSTNIPTSWSWTFGDGGTSPFQNATYLYTSFGKFPVSLQATNAGGSNTLSQPNYISACWGDNFEGSSMGSAWTTYSGVWVQSGQKLSQTSSATADPKKATVSNSGQTFGSNVTITAKVRIDSWTENADMSRGGVSLATGTADGRGYNFVFHNNHNTVAFLDDLVTWGPSFTYTWTTGTWYWFKLERDTTANALYGKVWKDGDAEPAAWTGTWAYNTGRTGYPALNGGSSDSNGYSTDSFMNVSVCMN
jgi:PKD repeat protein